MSLSLPVHHCNEGETMLLVVWRNISVRVGCIIFECNFYHFRDECTSFLSGKFVSLMTRCNDTEIRTDMSYLKISIVKTLKGQDWFFHNMDV